MTAKEMQAELERLKAENGALKAKGAAKVSLKVSTKGALSLYGVGRWPVTLYASQWETVLGKVEDVRAFLVTHKAELSVKPE
jgi:hypothetical protein